MKFLKEIIFTTLLTTLFLIPAFVQASQSSDQSSKQTRSPKIVNGITPADMKDWGFIARVYDNESSCTGMLIDEYWVLTAAHCVDDGEGGTRDPSGFLVSIGKKDTSASKEVFKVDEVFKHPGYRIVNDSGVFYHDIALIRLERPAKNKPIVRLPLNNDNDSPGIAKIAGYGKTCPEDKPECSNARFLLEARAQILEEKICNDKYNLSKDRQIICTQPVSPRYSSTCFGDSGGPLVVNKGPNRSPLVIGINSFTSGEGGYCSRYNTKGYTSTAKYIRWISYYVNRNVSISSSNLQISGMEDPKRRIATVTIKNTSMRWHLPTSQIIIRGAGRYCANKGFSAELSIRPGKLVKVKPCGVMQSLIGQYNEPYIYNSRTNPRLANKKTFRVIKNNCPLFKPGGQASSEYLITLLGFNWVSMLKPGASCQLKIQIISPKKIKLDFFDKKYGYRQMGWTAFDLFPGAQILQVEIGNSYYPYYNYSDVGLIQSCVDYTAKTNKNTWHSNCKQNIKALKADPAGEYFSRKCEATRTDGSVSDKCDKIWRRAYNKYG